MPPFDEDTYPGSEPEEGPEVWPDALEVVLARYGPGTEQQHDEQLTTQEIQTMLINHCGQAPTKPVLVEELTNRGYRYAAYSNGLEWHLQKKISY